MSKKDHKTLGYAWSAKRVTTRWYHEGGSCTVGDGAVIARSTTDYVEFACPRCGHVVYLELLGVRDVGNPIKERDIGYVVVFGFHCYGCDFTDTIKIGCLSTELATVLRDNLKIR